MAKAVGVQIACARTPHSSPRPTRARKQASISDSGDYVAFSGESTGSVYLWDTPSSQYKLAYTLTPPSSETWYSQARGWGREVATPHASRLRARTPRPPRPLPARRPTRAHRRAPSRPTARAARAASSSPLASPTSPPCSCASSSTRWPPARCSPTTCPPRTRSCRRGRAGRGRRAREGAAFGAALLTHSSLVPFRAHAPIIRRCPPS